MSPEDAPVNSNTSRDGTLVFDEVHNLLAGSPRERRVILQLFRHLSNELKASLVCLGVADARDAIAGDIQLARRLDQLVLPRWKGDEEFQEMVTAILRSLPLKRPSVLSAQGLRTSKRMIYYYFGSKEDLYRAVLEKAYSRIRAAEASLPLDSLDAVEALRRLVEQTFENDAANEDFVRLVAIENIHLGSGLIDQSQKMTAAAMQIAEK